MRCEAGGDLIRRREDEARTPASWSAVNCSSITSPKHRDSPDNDPRSTLDRLPWSPWQRRLLYKGESRHVFGVTLPAVMYGGGVYSFCDFGVVNVN